MSYRIAPALVVLALAGCASAPPVPLEPDPRPMAVERAVSLLGGAYVASDFVTGKPVGLRVDASALHVGLTGGRRERDVVCRYADTPTPMLDNSRIWMALVVACEVDKDPGNITFLLGFSSAAATPPEFARAWRVMLDLAAPESAEERAEFAAALAALRDGTVGPAISEDVRMHKVAAELAVKESRLWDAAGEFRQGLALAPWWAQGNYNLALVYGELRAYPLATRYMQRYLELAPDATNARTAQDRIYEWQAQARRTGT